MNTILDDNETTGVAILNRVLRFRDVTIAPDVARSLLSFRFPKADERRMDRLAAKARKGTLTDREQFAAEQYDLVSHMVALLQARARQELKPEENGSGRALDLRSRTRRVRSGPPTMLHTEAPIGA